ncbi:hypothetical protein [Campylobacter curvus]|uniref:hypothetical protein n=1 Tax=Campylobacter curvus TaxID=200 RepID=UPI00147040D8|nr:hypothetical protein [Campylobacter curvus]
MKFLLALFAALNFAFAGSNTELIKQLFTDPNFNKTAHFAGEMKERKFSVGKDVTLKGVSSLGIGESQDESDEYKVIRASIEQKDDWFDLYFFVKDEKIYAVRVLALMQIPKQIARSYDRASEADRRIIDIGQIRLMIARDSELVAFGRQNLDKFETIFQVKSAGEGAKAEQILSELHFTSAEFQNEIFILTIGGVTDNTVGFMRADEPSKLPKMSPHEYIMIEQISPKWYLFKTT